MVCLAVTMFSHIFIADFFCTMKYDISKNESLIHIFVYNLCLQLYNGASTSSPPLGSSPYCGTNEPSNLETSGNMLTVRFVSDGSGNGRGFSFNYLTMTAGNQPFVM